MNTIDTVCVASWMPQGGRKRRRQAAVLIVLLLWLCSCAPVADLVDTLEATRVAVGTVYVTPNAEGHVLPLLDRHFLRMSTMDALQRGQGPLPSAAGVILDGDDLTDSQIVSFARAAYDMGMTVAILEADAVEAETFALLVGHGHPVGLEENGDTVPLVAVRYDQSGSALVSRAHILQERTALFGGSEEGVAQADATEAAFLKAAFESLAVADLPRGDAKLLTAAGDGVDSELTQLGQSVLSHSVQTDSHGNSLQIVNNIWSTRSFTDPHVDYYYVQQIVTSHVGPSSDSNYSVFVESRATNTLTDPNITPTTQQFSPSTTGSTTTYKSGVDFTLGGKAGYSNGPAFLVTPSMKISNSSTTTVDSTQIQYKGDPATGVTDWLYITNCGDNCNVNDKTYGYTAHWIWAIPLEDYSPSQQTVSFKSDAWAEYLVPWGRFPEQSFSFTSTAPLPFNQTDLGSPTVAGVSSPTASRGDIVTITGSDFYLIDGVLIGGHSVPSANYHVVASNTTLQVVIPDDQPLGGNQSIVINTDEGISNSDVKISIQ